MLDRVEIYRGHGPSNLEEVGIGGAVLFEPRYPKGSSMRGGMTVGSWGSRSIYGALGQGSERSSAMVALRRESADNNYPYLENGGTADERWVTRDNAQQSTTDVWALSRMSLRKSGQILLLSNAFDRSQGITGISLYPAKHSSAHVSRELFGASSRATFGCSLATQCEVSGATSFQRALVSLQDPANELGLGAAGFTSIATRVTQRLEISWPLLDRVTFGTMGSGNVETLDVVQSGPSALDATRRQGTLGASSQWMPVDELILLGSARLVTQATQANAQLNSDTYPTGRIGGAIALLTGWQLLFNWGKYVRTPTLGELYGTSAAVAGNPSLQAEKGANLDLGTRVGVRGKLATLALEAYAFRQSVDGLISWQRSSFGQIKPYNVGQARLQGIENSLGLEILETLQVQSAVTLLDPRDTTPSRNPKNDIIPFRSRLVADVTIRLHTRPTSLGLSRAGISLRGAHRGSRYQDVPGLIIIPHSTTFDAGLDLALSAVPVSLQANVYNIFDYSSFDMVGYPLPPRTVMLGAEISWERHP